MKIKNTQFVRERFSDVRCEAHLVDLKIVGLVGNGTWGLQTFFNVNSVV